MAVSTIDPNGLNIGQIGGTRNLIINGAMQVAQRGTSVTGLNSDGYHTLDRWKMAFNTSGVITMSQDSTDTPPGFGSALKIATTTADTSIGSAEYLLLQCLNEGQNLQSIKKGTADAEPLTLSFYVKGNASATYAVELADDDNGRKVSRTFGVTSSWSRVVLTFPADTIGEFTNDNNNSLVVRFFLHGGSDYTSGTLNTNWTGSPATGSRAAGIDSILDSTSRTFHLTGVQLEVGDTATPFEHEPYSATYNKCLRYYYNTPVLRGGSNNPVVYTGNYVELQGTRHRFADVLGYRSQTAFHPVVMRATPTMTLYNPNNGGASGQWQLYNYDSATQNFGGFVGGGRATMFYLAGYTGVTVGGAGLSLISNCHWEADAEL